MKSNVRYSIEIETDDKGHAKAELFKDGNSVFTVFSDVIENDESKTIALPIIVMGDKSELIDFVLWLEGQ